MKQTPIVDDTDVDRMINFIFGKSVSTTIAPEERAEAAYQVALGLSRLEERSAAWAEALARKVRARALWITAPTGKVEEAP